MSEERRRVLVIEDDYDLAKAVADLLGDEGFDVTQRHDGESGLAEGLRGDYDVIVLDVMLPKRNGFSVCLDLRGAGVRVTEMQLQEPDLEDVFTDIMKRT